MEKRWRKKKYLNIPSKSFETSQKKLHHYINAPKEHSLIDHLDLFSHSLYQFAVEKPGTSGKGSDLRAPMFHGRIIWQWTSGGGFLSPWKIISCRCPPPSSVWSFAPPSPPYAPARNGHGCYSHDLIWELYPHVCVWNPRNDFGVLWLFSSFLASCPLQTSSIFIFFIFPSPPRKKIRSNPTPCPPPLGGLGFGGQLGVEDHDFHLLPDVPRDVMMKILDGDGDGDRLNNTGKLR